MSFYMYPWGVSKRGVILHMHMSCMFWRREYSYARSCLWRANMAGERRLNPALATTAQQLRFSNHGSATNPPSRFRNYASATTLQQPKLTLASAITLLKPKLTLASASATKIQKAKIIKVHAKSHLTRHIKIPTPSGKYMQSHILHVIYKPRPPLASTCEVTSYTSYQNPTPSGKYMQSHILHVIYNPHPLWQVHAKSHLTRHIKIPLPLASTCKVTSYTSYQNPNPLWRSGKYMQSHILHVISKSHSLWQVRAKSHLTRHIKIQPPLASTCKVTSYTSYQNHTLSGKYMQSHILHVISKSHPLWQVHAKSHLTRHIKIPLPLASTCKVTSYTSYQIPNPLWQVHAKSHLTRHIKLLPPLASTCEVTSYTSYQTPTPSGKHMQRSWFTKYSLRVMVYRSRRQPEKGCPNAKLICGHNQNSTGNLQIVLGLVSGFCGSCFGSQTGTVMLEFVPMHSTYTIAHPAWSRRSIGHNNRSDTTWHDYPSSRCDCFSLAGCDGCDGCGVRILVPHLLKEFLSMRLIWMFSLRRM